MLAEVQRRHVAGPDPAAELAAAAVRLGGQTIWSEATLRIEPGEFVAVLGPNGSGKSTLLRVLLGEQPLSAGTVSVLGTTPRTAKREIGYLPQRHAFDASTRIRGVDLVRLGLDGARWGLPLPGRKLERRRVEEAIALVDAAGYARRAIGDCSGGEQQRLLIAAALVSQPRMLFLDEPLDSLDLPNQTAVAALLNRICRAEAMTVLLVAHDVNPLLAHVDRVVYVAGGPDPLRAAGAGDHERDAERSSMGRRSKCCTPRTGASSSSASRRRRTIIPTDTRTRESAPLRQPADGLPPARRLPVHGQRARGGHDRRRDGVRRRLVHGAAARDVRRAHAVVDVVPGRERRRARRRLTLARLLLLLRRRSAR